MEGNSGIPAILCLPTIVGIFGCPYDVSFFNMLNSTVGSPALATMIEDLVQAHPKVFRRKYPQVSPTVQVGWHRLLDEFCLLLEAICDENELSSLQFHRILNESGVLILNFDFCCELSEWKGQTIDARVFALRNRSFFSCSACGCLVDNLKIPVLCQQHEKLYR